MDQKFLQCFKELAKTKIVFTIDETSLNIVSWHSFLVPSL